MQSKPRSKEPSAVLDTIMARKSIRAYSPEPIPQDTLDRLNEIISIVRCGPYGSSLRFSLVKRPYLRIFPSRSDSLSVLASLLFLSLSLRVYVALLSKPTDSLSFSPSWTFPVFPPPSHTYMHTQTHNILRSRIHTCMIVVRCWSMNACASNEVANALDG